METKRSGPPQISRLTRLSGLSIFLAMRPTNGTESQQTAPPAEPANGRRRSFIEEARRRQIVDTAIRTIAERGISQTTLAEIAKECGISKGVISYHFDGKDELITEVLTSLVRAPAEFVKERVERADTFAGKLRAYVEATLLYIERNRADFVALVDLWGSTGVSEGRRHFNQEAYEPSRHYIAHILEAGAAAGEFRPVAARTMASVIQAAIDGVMLQWVFEPDGIDLAACREELLAMITGHIAVDPKADRAPRSAKAGPATAAARGSGAGGALQRRKQ